MLVPTLTIMGLSTFAIGLGSFPLFPASIMLA